MEKIVFKDFSVGGRCDLFQYGVTYDCLDGRLTFFEIYAGTLNGIVGEFGDGGAILSYGLTNMRTHKVGSTRKKNNIGFYEGKIYVDDIIKNSWYIGYDIYGSHSPLFRRKTRGEPLYYEYGILHRRKTIKEQIEAGVQENRCDLNVDTIQEMFELLEPRLGRSINYVSGARWKSSIAIGYAYGKEIFCYPWMNSKDIGIMEEQIRKNIKILTDHNCFVVFPTTKEENIKKLATKYNIIYLD